MPHRETAACGAAAKARWVAPAPSSKRARNLFVRVPESRNRSNFQTSRSTKENAKEMETFQSGPIWLRKWSDMVVLKMISDHFERHIGPLSKPYRTTSESFPGKAATATAATAAVVIMAADSMIYNDHFC